MDYKAHEEDKEFQNSKQLLKESGVALPGIKLDAIARKNSRGRLKPFSIKQIRRDEERWEGVRKLTVHEYLGKPAFKNHLKIPQKEVAGSLENLLKICESKGISIVVRGFYPPIEIYSFVVNELFQWRVDTILQPDCVCKLIFEDYHPNHKIAIEDVSKRFLDLWIGRKIREFNFELSEVFVTSKGQIRSKYDVLSSMQTVFDRIVQISNARYYFSQVSFNYDEIEKSGTGHAEGMLSYTGHEKNGTTTVFQGAFKFYLTNEENGWEVFYFVLPGFNW